MTDQLVAEGLAAAFDLDDLRVALTGSRDERERAVMRLIAGAYKRGWDECERATQEALALYDMAHLVAGRVQ